MLSHRLHAAWVVARRDFVAVIFSKAFIFFLLGPLFPVFVGMMAGSIGASVQRDADRPVIGLAMPAHEADLMVVARDAVARQLDGRVPEMVVLKRLRAGEGFDARGALRDGRIAAVVTGPRDAPLLTATPERVDQWRGMVGLVAARAAEARPNGYPIVQVEEVQTSVAKQRGDRMVTAQAGQILLFLLTLLLAGMVLSNLVEEKANKIIEILAASIPMDMMFLGKLLAMLAVSVVAMAVWGSGYGVLVLSGARTVPILVEPAVGWPMFLVLGFAYFATAYLLLGSMFLTIGGLATTVREVQTLSMPATMLQLLVFFLASYALGQKGTWVELAAQLFPISSPYAMIAMAAQSPDLLPHVLALAWQGLWVAVMVRLGSQLFRRTVMKSGPARPRKSRRAKAVTA